MDNIVALALVLVFSRHVIFMTENKRKSGKHNEKQIKCYILQKEKKMSTNVQT